MVFGFAERKDERLAQHFAKPGVEHVIAVPDQMARKRVRWTAEEEHALRTGVELHGAGNWRRIMRSQIFGPTRTNVDLKDKWRNMTMSGQVTLSSAQQPAPALPAPNAARREDTLDVQVPQPTSAALPLECDREGKVSVGWRTRRTRTASLGPRNSWT